MKITVFTSNQPRHLALLRSLTKVAPEVFAVIETNTIFPGIGKGIYRQTDTMERYMARVRKAEISVFGTPGFIPKGVQARILQFGDLRRIEPFDLAEAGEADLFISFGCGFIKGPLFDFLEERRAVNIHMGVSPHFRGSSCNFWAVHDGHADKVGATIHLLGRELDAGEILFHALPSAGEYDSFELGMRAVSAAHSGLVDWIQSGRLINELPLAQDRSKEIRYSVNADFTDAIAEQCLENPPNPKDILKQIQARNLSEFIRPWVGN